MVEIVAGKVVQLTKNVRRITAPNPGMMTGPGTNTYLVGSDQIAVIDPGPAEPSHIEAILAACDGKLAWILVTHTHPDHSPAAAVLAKETGAMLMGNVLKENDGHQDDSFIPDESFSHNQCLSSAEFTIRAIHTPGHVDNHICFLVEEDGLLLTGDHIMQGSTVVIIPPYGDMKDYIESLRLLLDYSIDALGPAHGHLIDTPKKEIQYLIDHRLGRETKVVSVLSKERAGTLDSLTPLVYDDVDAKLHPIARYSLLAHLLKLEKDQRAEHTDEKWTFTD
jgi:glyoxylase-like metal-dependent hydrolase (beta-lactamase superfamily II)